MADELEAMSTCKIKGTAHMIHQLDTRKHCVEWMVKVLVA